MSHDRYRPVVKRDPTLIVCTRHGVEFVKFGTNQFAVSHGCPICVEHIRKKIEVEKTRNKFISQSVSP
jgi:hypothetical protein